MSLQSAIYFLSFAKMGEIIQIKKPMSNKDKIQKGLAPLGDKALPLFS